MAEWNGGEDLLRFLVKKINKNQWICMFTGVFTGIITHLYMLTNKLPNWDDLNNIGSYGAAREVGRWMIPRLHALGGEWSAPALNGMMAILLIALASGFIFAALELETTTSAVLLPIIMLTFPGVAGTMTFMFTAHIYSFAMLLGCVGAWLIRRFAYGWIPGILLLVMTMGTYQSYICLVSGVLVLSCLFDLFREREVKQILQKGLISIGSIGTSMLLYVFVSRHVFGGLSEYKGASSMGELDWGTLPREIARTYKRILEYFLIEPWSFVSDRGRWLNVLVILGLAILFVILVWKRKLYQERGRLLLIALLTMLFPLSLTAIYVIAPEANPTVLILYQYFLVYVVLLGLLEVFMGNKLIFLPNLPWVKGVLGFGFMAIVFAVGYDNYVLTNNAYFRMDIAFTRIHSFYERLYLRVTEQEEYGYGDQIAILGDWWPERNILSSYGMDLERYDEFEGVAMENGLFTTGVRQNFMKTYLGVDFPEISHKQMGELMKTKTFINMPDYPAEGCVQRIDGIWVVKVAD